MTINMMTTVTQGSTHLGDDHNGDNDDNNIYDDDQYGKLMITMMMRVTQVST